MNSYRIDSGEKKDLNYILPVKGKSVLQVVSGMEFRQSTMSMKSNPEARYYFNGYVDTI